MCILRPGRQTQAQRHAASASPKRHDTVSRQRRKGLFSSLLRLAAPVTENPCQPSCRQFRLAHHVGTVGTADPTIQPLRLPHLLPRLSSRTRLGGGFGGVRSRIIPSQQPSHEYQAQHGYRPEQPRPEAFIECRHLSFPSVPSIPCAAGMWPLRSVRS